MARRTTRKSPQKAAKKKPRKPAARGAAGRKQDLARQEDRLRTVLEHIQPAFVEHGARRIRPTDVAAVLEAAGDLEESLRDGRTLQRYELDLRAFVSLLEDCSAGEYREASYWCVAVMTFALQYVLKPVDIIPDSLPAIGLLDDAMVVAHALTMVRDELHLYRVWKLARQLEE